MRPSVTSIGPDCVAKSREPLSPRTRSDIAHNRGHAAHPAGLVLKGHDRKLHRNPRSVLPYARNREEISVPVTALTRLHDLPVSLPVPGAKVLGNDQVER